MKSDFLLHAIGQADDRYLQQATQLRGQKKKLRISWKLCLAAALIPLLVVTAVAQDMLNIHSLNSGAVRYSGSSYRQMDTAMEKAGFQMDVKEQFHNGYTFDRVTVQDTVARDEDGRAVLTYPDIDVIYRTQTGNRLYLHAYQKQEEIIQSDHAPGQTRTIRGITTGYYLDHYKMVPTDYELTEADKRWEQQPGNFVSVGSDAVEETDAAFLCWEKDGICYSIMDMGAEETPDTLFSMAAELIGS